MSVISFHRSRIAVLTVVACGTLCLTGCGAESERFDTPVGNRDAGVYLQVLDAQGYPVEGVEVHVITVPDVELGDATISIDPATCYGTEQ